MGKWRSGRSEGGRTRRKQSLIRTHTHTGFPPRRQDWVTILRRIKGGGGGVAALVHDRRRRCGGAEADMTQVSLCLTTIRPARTASAELDS